MNDGHGHALFINLTNIYAYCISQKPVNNHAQNMDLNNIYDFEIHITI